ncbi:hypothetical protein [Tenacibaculum discolor]|uniref:hypothetical protein n=1 Tax=Tenacibaculum discolor TaxID=361581 RepID=UPI000EB14611|nr:hypothetical protein [Tenacibaculum discolor]RLK02524.1 hypothetical protein C8N27_1666 [Tenacibaculum discolor]
MNFKTSLVILLNLSLTFSCLAQDNAPITLEGKWKVVDWTYMSFVGRGLDGKEKQEIDKTVSDLVLDFKLNQTFSSNKPAFQFLENQKFFVNNFSEVVINNQYYPIFIKNNTCYFLLSNIMLQIKKTENYKNSKINIEKFPSKYNEIEESFKKEKKISGEVYSINDLDKPPKFKTVEFDENCLIDCLLNSFNSNMKYYIDFSKVEKDTSYFIEFTVDNTGNIYNIHIKSKNNKPSNGLTMTAKVIYGTKENNKESKKGKITGIEKNIISSILAFKNQLIAGKKNNKNVNTKLNLELRLISK